MTNLFLVLLLSIPFSSLAACLPETGTTSNKRLMGFTIAMKSIEEAAARFEAVIEPAIPIDHELVINLEPQNPRVNAEIIKNERNLVVSVWGGMLSHSLMNSETFQLLLCHEIGHFLGGPPLKSRNGWSSTEGQADYYSGLRCAKDLGWDEAQFSQAALALTRIYAEVTNVSGPSLNRCDETKVTRINYGYPIAQCRLDTLIAGWKGQPRPACWYVGP